MAFKPEAILTGHVKAVSSVTFSTDGQFLASCSADTTGRVWPLEEEVGPVQELKGHTAGLNDICWHPHLPCTATASDDMTLGVWDAETGLRLLRLESHTHFVYSCKFHPQGNVLASGSLDESLRYWDIRTGACIKSIPAHSDPVTGVDFTWDGTMIASTSTDGLSRLWDFSTGHLLRTLLDAPSPPITGVRFSPNGRYILESVVGPDACLRLWDWCPQRGPNADRGEVTRRFTGHTNRLYSMPFQFLHGTHVLSGTEDGNVMVWNINTAKTSTHTVDVITDEMVAAHGQPNHEEQTAKPSSDVKRKLQAASAAPRTVIALDAHSASGVMATTQIADPMHAIYVSAVPDVRDA